MLHEIERPAAVGAANGPETKVLRDELLQYGRGCGGTQDPYAIWRAAFTRSGSMRAAQAAVGFASPAVEPMQARSINGRRTQAVRNLGFAGLESGGVLIPLYCRDNDVAYLQPWRGWTCVAEPNPRACMMGLDDFQRVPCEPPVAAVLEIAGTGAHRMTGERFAMIHAHARAVNGKLTLEIRVAARPWLADISFFETSPEGDCTVSFPTALALGTTGAAIVAIAEALAYVPNLAEIRVLDAGPRSETFGARLQTALTKRKPSRTPRVLVAQPVTGGGA